MLSFVAVHPTREVTRNLAIDPGLAEVAAQLDPDQPPRSRTRHCTRASSTCTSW